MRWVIIIFVLVIYSVCFAINSYGQNKKSWGQSSIIVSSEGIACMGKSKIGGDIKDEALIQAKENAIRLAFSSLINNAQADDGPMVKNLKDAYDRGNVRILSQIGSGWIINEQSDRCYRAKIKAEIIPELIKSRGVSEHRSLVQNLNTSLSVRLELEKHEFRANEEIHMFVKGNKDFYALIIYKNASGDLLQLFPNPYQSENYLKAGVVYHIPSENDSFKLIVSAPFGDESIILYASTMPLGNLEITPTGAFYHVETPSSEVEIRVRGGIDLRGGEDKVHKPVQFSTNRVTLWTRE